MVDGEPENTQMGFLNTVTVVLGEGVTAVPPAPVQERVYVVVLPGVTKVELAGGLTEPTPLSIVHALVFEHVQERVD